MAISSPERVRDDLTRLLHRGAGVQEFSLAAARILARSVPFDGVCVLTMDPATLVPTGEVVENGLPPEATIQMTEIEMRGDDFNAFAALARAPRRAATLSAATGGDLDRSQRHRELRRPSGFGDELRAVLTDDSTTWGALTLLRASDRPDFAAADAQLVATVTAQLAEGLRRATLLNGQRREGEHEQSDGLVLLEADNSISFADLPAEMWLGDLAAGEPGEPLPPVVAAVAARARTIAGGHAPDDAIARARVRTASGQWLVVRGTTIGDQAGGQTAVMIEPARPHELAPLAAEAYELTERERAVTELVAQGLATAAIADRLWISAWTVQDHLKSVFEKVGVGTRGELIARVFFAPDVPGLTDGQAQSRRPGTDVSALQPVRACDPSQNGLRAESPQRHR